MLPHPINAKYGSLLSAAVYFIMFFVVSTFLLPDCNSGGLLCNVYNMHTHCAANSLKAATVLEYV